MTLNVQFEERSQFNVLFTNDTSLLTDLGAVTVVTDPSEIPIYGGAYIVTPSAQTQTLNTDGKMMVTPVVINPIPSNYGLITYDGYEITVS